MIKAGSKVKCIKFAGVTERLNPEDVYTVRYVEFNQHTQSHWLHLEVSATSPLSALPIEFFEEV